MLGVEQKSEHPDKRFVNRGAQMFIDRRYTFNLSATSFNSFTISCN